MRLEAECSRFLDWVNGASNTPPLLKPAFATGGAQR